MFQLIYQLLTSSPLTLKKIKNKKELKSSHINIILKKLWNELKDLNPNDLANRELVSSRRRIRNYFYNKYDFPDYRSFKEDLQEDKVRDILCRGFFLDSKGNKVKLDKSRWVDQLVPHYINPTYSGLTPESCILRLFRRLTIDQIWDKFYRYSNNLL
jgi:hypothetical protein